MESSDTIIRRFRTDDYENVLEIMERDDIL
jgi:hypothetical protein